MPDGVVPELFTLEQWREFARETSFDLQRLAASPEISLSVRTIERLFENRFGAPPCHWLMQWRAEDARDYILSTGASNKQAADRFGYTDQAHLCHVFKRLFNRSPQSFSPRPVKDSARKPFVQSALHKTQTPYADRAKKKKAGPGVCASALVRTGQADKLVFHRRLQRTLRAGPYRRVGRESEGVNKL